MMIFGKEARQLDLGRQVYDEAGPKILKLPHVDHVQDGHDDDTHDIEDGHDDDTHNVEDNHDDGQGDQQDEHFGNMQDDVDEYLESKGYFHYYENDGIVDVDDV